jgi:hypothetical protein
VTVEFELIPTTAGNLTVTITTPAPSGAQWSVDGGATWRNSGETVNGIAADNATVTFKAVSGWFTPMSQTVIITACETATTSGAYTQPTLTTSVVNGHGTLAPATGSQNANAVVTLTATPDSGYRVKAWTGAATEPSTANTNAVTMTGDKTVTVEFEAITVPSVVGQTQSAAQNAITNAGLTVGAVTLEYNDSVPSEDVISQIPAAGTSVAPSIPVDLIVSKGPKPWFECFGEAIDNTSFGSPTEIGGDAVLLLSVSVGLFLVGSRRQRSPSPR